MLVRAFPAQEKPGCASARSSSPMHTWHTTAKATRSGLTACLPQQDVHAVRRAESLQFLFWNASRRLTSCWFTIQNEGSLVRQSRPVEFCVNCLGSWTRRALFGYVFEFERQAECGFITFTFTVLAQLGNPLRNQSLALSVPRRGELLLIFDVLIRVAI